MCLFEKKGSRHFFPADSPLMDQRSHGQGRAMRRTSWLRAEGGRDGTIFAQKLTKEDFS